MLTFSRWHLQWCCPQGADWACLEANFFCPQSCLCLEPFALACLGLANTVSALVRPNTFCLSLDFKLGCIVHAWLTRNFSSWCWQNATEIKHEHSINVTCYLLTLILDRCLIVHSVLPRCWDWDPCFTSVIPRLGCGSSCPLGLVCAFSLLPYRLSLIVLTISLTFSGDGSNFG